MKKLLTLFLAVLACSTMIQACLKKPSLRGGDNAETVIIVMDTAQSLLANARVQIGKEEFKTSWDGRIVLKSGIPAGTKSIVVTREQYDTITVTDKEWAGQGRLLIFALTPQPGTVRESYSLGAAKTGALSRGLYYKLDVMPSVADGYVEMSEPEETVMAGETERKPKPVGALSNKISAGKLTAGEVNDFAKWYFWNKVLDDTHKNYINTWKINTRNRYTVQLTNQDGYPIVSQQVNLVDKKGNTLFQAVTDNTGKAELWANLLIGKEKNDNFLICVNNKNYPAKPWAEGLNTIVLEEECGASDAVDVVFVFDATGSMGDELNYLQAEMRDVIERAKDATGGLAIRTGAVVYRDHGDAYLTRLSRLTEDIKTTQAFIDKQHADGGGDFPEAVPEALMAAVNTAGWDVNARARIAFLVLDAPCHEGQETIDLLHEQILNAAAYGIRIVPVVCSGLDASGELLMRSIALATNGTAFFLTDDSGIGNPHLKPTTDTLNVEHLNDMLVRTIVEFSTMPDCNMAMAENAGPDENFIPNPFDPQPETNLENIPHGPTTVYLLDVTGKLIAILNGDINTIQISKATFPISTGVYFLKTYNDGKWYTKKILVN